MGFRMNGRCVVGILIVDVGHRFGLDGWTVWRFAVVIVGRFAGAGCGRCDGYVVVVPNVARNLLEHINKGLMR